MAAQPVLMSLPRNGRAVERSRFSLIPQIGKSTGKQPVLCEMRKCSKCGSRILCWRFRAGAEPNQWLLLRKSMDFRLAGSVGSGG